MPSYEVNEDGVRHAQQLIDRGEVDTDTEWSDAAPSASDENDEIERAADDLLARLDAKQS